MAHEQASGGAGSGEAAERGALQALFDGFEANVEGEPRGSQKACIAPSPPRESQ